MLSSVFRDYLRFWREMFCSSTSVSPQKSFFFLLGFISIKVFSVFSTFSLRSGATALDGKYRGVKGGIWIRRKWGHN